MQQRDKAEHGVMILLTNDQRRWACLIWLIVFTVGMALAGALGVVLNTWTSEGIGAVSAGRVVDGSISRAFCGFGIGLTLWFAVVRPKLRVVSGAEKK